MSVQHLPERVLPGRRFAKPTGAEARWLLRVRIEADGCWTWTGARWARYGKFCLPVTQQRVVAHRWGYEHFIGPVPDGMELDHLCRNIWCVNPAHLEPVTHVENVRRGASGEVARLRQQSKTHCPAGHPYNEQNTYVTPRGSRTCRPCQAAAKRARRTAA